MLNPAAVIMTCMIVINNAEASVVAYKESMQSLWVQVAAPDYG